VTELSYIPLNAVSLDALGVDGANEKLENKLQWTTQNNILLAV
jgi:hypothetical protein